MDTNQFWKKLVYQNLKFQQSLTQLIREDCRQDIDSVSWENILNRLATNCDDPFALVARSRYYLAVANDQESIRKGNYYVNKALIDIESCLKKIKDSVCFESEANLVHDFYGLVRLPYSVIYHQAGSLYGLYKTKSDKALHYFQLYQKCQMIVSPIERYPTLLSFRNYSEFVLSDLIKHQVTVMPPRVMNDCLDSLFFPWVHSHEESIKQRIAKESDKAKKNNLQKNLEVIRLLSESMNYYRIRAFVDPKRNGHDNIQNPLMWAHYANEHKGLAILYRFKDDEIYHVDKNRIWKFRAIQYAKKNETIDVSKDTISIDKAFLTKSNEWSYEDEVRLLSYDCSVKSDYNQIPIGTIEEVYFGIRCPEQTIDTVKSLLASYPQKVIFYKMKIDETNIYKLKLEKL